MKTIPHISIATPCSENFDTFIRTKNGGFCSSCQKEVIDFTAMSDTRLIDFLTSNNEKLCGRFKSSQLALAPTAKHTPILRKSLGIASVAVMSLVIAPFAQAQDQALKDPIAIEQTVNTKSMILVQQDQYTVKGVVYDESNLPLAGANVVLKGSKTGVSTDMDGEFEFPKPLKAGETLVFSYLGYDPKEYTVEQSTSETIEVTIQFDSSDVVLMGEVVTDQPYTSKRGFFKRLGSIFKK